MTSIYSNYNINGNFNLPKISFRSAPNIYAPAVAPAKDGYVSNPLYEKFGTKAEIEAEAANNPRIREILSKHNLPVKVNEAELEKLKSGHLQDTRIAAAKIYSNLPSDLKAQVNPVVLQQAAMLHDYGKVLIPEKILNKNSALSDEEWEIMEEHAEIGAELLKRKNLDDRTLELIKYHHQRPDNSGYPAIQDDYEYGLDSEILAVADKYAALKEERSYKEAMSNEDALSIIKEDVDSGIISGEVFDALKKSV